MDGTKLLTFSDASKPFTLDKAVKVTVDSDVQFRRLFDVSNQRDVNLQKMMAHEL